MSNILNEDAANSVLYKGTHYSLMNAQFVSPSHNGYLQSYQPTPPFMELILTFFSGQVIGTYPNIILFIVPIFTNNWNQNATYLQQLLNPDVASTTVATLQDVFSSVEMKSYGYKTCIDMYPQAEQEGTPASLNVFVLYFSNGIVITQQESTSLKTLVTPTNSFLPVYRLPHHLLNGLSTVQNYQMDSSGDFEPIVLSSKGEIGIQALVVSSEEFTNVMQYYSKPPSVTSSAGPSCPAYTTSQYQCLPFNKFYDLSANLADPNNPQVILSSLLNKQQPNSISLFAGTNLWSIVFDVFMGIFAVIVVGVILYVFIKGDAITDPPDIDATGAAGAAGAGAAGAGAGGGTPVT